MFAYSQSHAKPNQTNTDTQLKPTTSALATEEKEEAQTGKSAFELDFPAPESLLLCRRHMVNIIHFLFVSSPRAFISSQREGDATKQVHLRSTPWLFLTVPQVFQIASHSLWGLRAKQQNANFSLKCYP